MKKTPRISFNLPAKGGGRLLTCWVSRYVLRRGKRSEAEYRPRRCFLFSEGNGLAGAGPVEALGNLTTADA
jgi:hypothetical protein